MIRRQVVVPAPPEAVWEALVDADRSEAWMGGRLILSELAPGAPLEFRPGDGSGPVRDGSVDTVRPGRYLRFQWREVRQGDGDPAPASEVSYLLEPDSEGGTRLTVQESEVPPSPVASRHLDAGTSRRWTAADDVGFASWARAQGRALAFAGR
ncbi:MAG: SRPBCC domain-containing protein [Acidimicrobiales bacterium]|nr:SRPBCC domain-containing protein [Acidimicrobiales bacterium]